MYLVSQKVEKILAEILEVDDEDITPETELTTASGIEAIHIAKMVIECEKKFNITIHDEDVHTFKYLHDLAKYIETILSDV